MLNRNLSDNLKTEIAKELGVYALVEKSGWRAVSTHTCGNALPKGKKAFRKDSEI